MFKLSGSHGAFASRHKKALVAAAVALSVGLGSVGVGAIADANAAQAPQLSTVETDFLPTEQDIAETTPDAEDAPSRGGLQSLSEESGTSAIPVQVAQKKLLAAGYWLSGVDGKYGTTSRQAVYAFQKVNGLKRTGVLDAKTSKALMSAKRPSPGVKLTNGMEIDKARQVIKVIRNGRVVWVFNTSTGSGRKYKEKGGSGVAITPSGTFKFQRSIDGVRHAPLGDLYRPRYFNGGIAIHGAPSIPPYPASHGCARMSNAAIDFVWSKGLAPIGSTVVVH